MSKRKKQKQFHQYVIEQIGINARLVPLVFIITILAAAIGLYVFTIGLRTIVHSQETYVPPDIIDEFKRETPHPIIPPHTDQIVFHGVRMFPKVALTYDGDMTAGMEEALKSGKVASYYDDKLIHILQSTHTKATLFLTGMWIESYPKEAQKLARDPLFELSNHSYDHRGMDGSCYGLAPVPDTGDIDEVMKTQRLLQNLGVTNYFFRFPGGCYSQGDLDILSSLGITAIQWDVAGVDGFNDNQANIESNVLDHVENGSIIVMHMNGYPNEPRTADATADIIFQLRKRGFEFVTVSELLGM